ncbi:ankyrin repeat family protein [Anaeramoeba flamelloides]|uniref:Ankyrin repeat family protein n=1 Tax=Anaeramoeba flamelloides TaxID=1746091 RepID=A0ABQ8Z5Q2_9EUKA|nr:ankyrin repeat family protein [Anaeramoeba flamelloides]
MSTNPNPQLVINNNSPNFDQPNTDNLIPNSQNQINQINTTQLAENTQDTSTEEQQKKKKRFNISQLNRPEIETETKKKTITLIKPKPKTVIKPKTKFTIKAKKKTKTKRKKSPNKRTKTKRRLIINISQQIKNLVIEERKKFQIKENEIEDLNQSPTIRDLLEEFLKTQEKPLIEQQNQIPLQAPGEFVQWIYNLFDLFLEKYLLYNVEKDTYNEMKKITLKSFTNIFGIEHLCRFLITLNYIFTTEFDSPIPKGVTAFGILVKRRHSLEYLKHLLEINNKENVKLLKKCKFPIIHYCSRHSDITYLKFLHSYGFDFEKRDKNNLTALMYGCSKGTKSKLFIEYLLDNGADVNAHSTYKGTPLIILSSRTSDLNLLKKFIERGAKVIVECEGNQENQENIENKYQKKKINIFLQTCKQNNVSVEVLDYCYSLIKENKKINQNQIFYQSALYLVLSNGNLKALKQLVLWGLDLLSINNKKDNVLFRSIRANVELELIEYLIDEIGFGVDGCYGEYSYAIIQKAIAERVGIQIIKYLLSKGSKVNVDFDLYSEYLSYSIKKNVGYSILLDYIYGFYQYEIRDINMKKTTLNEKETEMEIKKKNDEKVDLLIQLLKSGFNFHFAKFYKINHPLNQYFLLNFELLENSFKIILDSGFNPWFHIFKKMNLFEFTKEIYFKKIHKYIIYYFSIVQDFHELLIRKENTDLVIISSDDYEIPVHSFIVKIRLINDNITIEKICKVLKNENKTDIMQFLLWVYGGYANHTNHTINDKIWEIVKKIGFTKELFRKKNGRKGLLFDLQQIYENKHLIDFKIIVNIDGAVNEEQNKIDEIKGGEEKGKKKGNSDGNGKKLIELPVHKLILQARSGLFRGLFLNISDQSSIHDYTCKSPKAIEILLNFLYTEKIMGIYDEEILLELFDAIDYYQLSETSSLNSQISKAQTRINEEMNPFYNQSIEKN